MSLVDHLRDLLAKLPLEDLHRRELAVLQREAEFELKQFEAEKKAIQAACESEKRDLRSKLDAADAQLAEAKETLRFKDEAIEKQREEIRIKSETIQHFQELVHRLRSSDELDDIAIRILVKIAREPGPWAQARLAEALGVELVTVQHRLQLLVKRRFLSMPAISLGAPASGWMLRPEGLDWLHRHKHIS